MSSHSQSTGTTGTSSKNSTESNVIFLQRLGFPLADYQGSNTQQTNGASHGSSDRRIILKRLEDLETAYLFEDFTLITRYSQHNSVPFKRIPRDTNTIALLSPLYHDLKIRAQECLVSNAAITTALIYRCQIIQWLSEHTQYLCAEDDASAESMRLSMSTNAAFSHWFEMLQLEYLSLYYALRANYAIEMYNFKDLSLHLYLCRSMLDKSLNIYRQFQIPKPSFVLELIMKHISKFLFNRAFLVFQIPLKKQKSISPVSINDTLFHESFVARIESLVVDDSLSMIESIGLIYRIPENDESFRFHGEGYVSGALPRQNLTGLNSYPIIFQHSNDEKSSVDNHLPSIVSILLQSNQDGTENYQLRFFDRKLQKTFFIGRAGLNMFLVSLLMGDQSTRDQSVKNLAILTSSIGKF